MHKQLLLAYLNYITHRSCFNFSMCLKLFVCPLTKWMFCSNWFSRSSKQNQCSQLENNYKQFTLRVAKEGQSIGALWPGEKPGMVVCYSSNNNSETTKKQKRRIAEIFRQGSGKWIKHWDKLEAFQSHHNEPAAATEGLEKATNWQQKTNSPSNRWRESPRTQMFSEVWISDFWSKQQSGSNSGSDT